MSDESRMSARRLTLQDYVSGVLDRNRSILARAITVIESSHPRHKELAQEIINTILPHTGNSSRIGISGVPGAGKSTFIEVLGLQLCRADQRVAVLAVDPSSSLTRGSILGDKTRMERLSQHPDAFIRPSPSSGTLGGVSRKTRETMLLCEAAGFNIILVETVGVGQSEISVRSMVDFFLLLALTGAGDELQSIKKGIMEIADAVVINKGDGDNLIKANRVRGELMKALHYLPVHLQAHLPLPDRLAEWSTEVLVCSAMNGTGIPEIWSCIARFLSVTKESGAFTRRRQVQQLEWFRALLQEEVMSRVLSDERLRQALVAIEGEITEGRLAVSKGVQDLLSQLPKAVLG